MFRLRIYNTENAKPSISENILEKILIMFFLFKLFHYICDDSDYGGNWNHFYYEKGVIEIIFISQILAKFEMVRR